MALTVGTNSWVTIAESNTYFSEQYGRDAWGDGTVSDADKEKLLIHAYRWINQQQEISIDPEATADIVKQAQMELSWYIYNFFAEHERRRALNAQGVKQFRIGQFSESIEKNGFPAFIIDMLEDYADDSGGQFPVITRDLENA